MLWKLLRDEVKPAFIGGRLRRPRADLPRRPPRHLQGQPAAGCRTICGRRCRWCTTIADAFRLQVSAEPGVEADDVIAPWSAARRGFDFVVVTGDKDLMQLVGPRVRLWDTMRDRWVDEAAGREKFGVEPRRCIDVWR
jgi:hypothetical protein